MTPITHTPPSHTTKFLTFSLGSENYAFPALNVLEILKSLPLTPVPNNPPSLHGILNLRGKLIPIFHLSTMLSLPPSSDLFSDSCYVVCSLDSHNHALCGFIVDSVQEVTTMPIDSLQDKSDFIQSKATQPYITAIANLNNKLFTLLDINKLPLPSLP